MADLIWLVVIGGAVVFGLLPLCGGHAKTERTVKGLTLSPVDWALLGDIAVKRRVSQSALIAQIVSDYLTDQVAETRHARVKKKFHKGRAQDDDLL